MKFIHSVVSKQEADAHCNSNHLQNLLLLLKSWGQDKQLVRAVVTLSSLRVPLGLSIGMEELHTEILELEDYTGEEGYQYMHSFIKSYVECSEDEFREFCLNLFRRLGRCPLHLQTLCNALSKSRKSTARMSLGTLEKKIVTYLKGLTTRYVYILRSFRFRVSKQKKFDKFFEHLQKE